MKLDKFIRGIVNFSSIPFLILTFSCNSQEHRSNESLLGDFRISSDIGYQIISTKNLDSSNVKFRDLTFQYHNNRNKVFFYDKHGQKQLIYNLSSDSIDVISRDTYIETPFFPTSVTENDSIQYVLYLHQFTIAKVKKNSDSVSAIALDDFSEQSIHSDTHRFEVLENGSFIIPTAINVLSDLGYYQQNLDKGLDEIMEEQHLFHLFGESGQLLKTFGKFPQSNYVTEPSLPFNPHYMYVVKDGFIYVTFPMGQELYKYDYNGNLIDSVNIELPEFNYSINPGHWGNDAKIGLGIEKDSNQEILYFHTINHINDNKIRHFIYKINLSEKVLEFGEIMNGNNYMMPYVYNDSISFLKKYFMEEKREIVTMKLTK
ncbi:hypothetical protein [uncultured Marivirga sp.]|uniref:hypothetical protein n=1 Tax=uncultured Marivirga sp. TaxID=1123707 RepID=UPI0030EE145C|tara:strand:- start:6706 stop:7824 length:1119 start_codon:yes stop_codon:yes gene_type:complete